MKIAVSSQGPTLDSELDPRFGRTSGFVLFDTATGEASFLDNTTNQAQAQGAGISTAQMLARTGAHVVITGQVGAKAAQALNYSNITVYSCQMGTVRQALEALRQSRLSHLTPEQAEPGPGETGGRGMGGGGRGRGPESEGQGPGSGGRDRGPDQGGRGQGGGRGG